MATKRIGATVAASSSLGVALLSACSGSDSDGCVAARPDPVVAPALGCRRGRCPHVPPPEGEVVGVGTVMDTGQGDPELCLGAIAESYPPQCSGIPITNWDWAPVEDTFESSGTTRWGSYAVTGTYDGKTFTVTQDPVSLGALRPGRAGRRPVPDPLPRARGRVGRRRPRQGRL